MPGRAEAPEWYKNAIICGVDVGTFMDIDGGDIQDFPGLRFRLYYIASLGVTCFWILSCFPTPNKDNGYDIVTTAMSTAGSARSAISSPSCAMPPAVACM